MKIVVLGCKGQLGKCLYDQLENTDYEVVFTSREQINIIDFEATKTELLDMAPDVIINASAYTAVDKAEQEQEKADLINHLAVKNIAEISNIMGCWLIHVSTDYVFDGASRVRYQENDQTNPQCVYGLTKLHGELAIQSSGCKYIIIRTAWVFSEYGNNFLKTILRLGSERDTLDIVGDQIGCPTYARDLAKATVCTLPFLGNAQESGIYNYAGDKSCSWAEFAELIFRKAKKLGKMKCVPQVVAITTKEYPTPAKRPKNSRLDSSLFETYFGCKASDWEAKVSEVLRLEQQIQRNSYEKY